MILHATSSSSDKFIRATEVLNGGPLRRTPDATPYWDTLMLHRKQPSFKARTVARVLSWSAGVLAVVAGGFLRAPEKPEFGAGYEWLRQTAASHAWLVLIAAPSITGMARWAAKKIGNPETWEIIHALLSDLRDHVFSQAKHEDNPSYHRATLFKGRAMRDWWDIKGLAIYAFTRQPRWLVAVVRSKHASQSGITHFGIGDQEQHCTGIGGKAWFSGRVESVHDLPDLSNSPSTEDIKLYAKKSRVSSEKLKKKTPGCRALLAVPILCSNGEMWGVLVFDSRIPDKIAGDEVEKMLQKVFGRHLTRLLEKSL